MNETKKQLDPESNRLLLEDLAELARMEEEEDRDEIWDEDIWFDNEDYPIHPVGGYLRREDL